MFLTEDDLGCCTNAQNKINKEEFELLKNKLQFQGDFDLVPEFRLLR